MVVHKIQSSVGVGLTLQLDDVPKVLKRLVSEWIPSAFVVSFKLETDPALVVPKARRAIEKYGVHLVIANQLQVQYLYSTVQYIDHISHYGNIYNIT